MFLMNKCGRIAERIRGVVSSQLDITDGDDYGRAQIVTEPSTLDPRFVILLNYSVISAQIEDQNSIFFISSSVRIITHHILYTKEMHYLTKIKYTHKQRCQSSGNLSQMLLYKSIGKSAFSGNW